MKVAIVAFAVLTASCSTFSLDLSTRSHAEACDALDAALPGKLSYPNSTAYALSNSNYWSSRQSELKPACLLFPRSVEDVSLALEILAAHDAPFNVKSGGHNAFPAASNIQDGVSISLEHLNGTTVSADRRTVSLEPGVRWINVSQTLDPLGLAVVGGRAADVGVSGFILGGGISYLSGQHGWACDNVQNFQVVLASGEIVDANPDENSDLYWALRGGGGSSFGIVTRFDVDAYEQGDLWLRNIIFPDVRRNDVIGEFTLVTREVLPLDKDAHNFLVMAYVEDLGGFITMTYMYHLTHAQAPAETNPDVYEGYIRLRGSIVDETTVANVSTHLLALNEEYGQRHTWWDTTVSIQGGGGAQLLQDIVPEWQDVANSLMAAAKSRNSTLTPYIVYHPLSVNVLEAMRKNGGNALGLDPESGPLVLVHVRVTWTDAALDELVESSLETLIGEIETLAESRGLGNGFKYMNYAGQTQDVLRSYGEENLQRLRTVAEKYDPTGQLQGLWKGYFQVA